MSRRPDLPAADEPTPAAGTGWRGRVQGLSSAVLALVLLVAMIGTQRPAQEPAQPLAPVPPPQAQRAAEPPPVAAPPVQEARAAVAPRTQPKARRAAPRPAVKARRAVVPTARPDAVVAPLPVHGPMERRYVTEAHTAGVCPAGTQSSDLGLTCRGASVRQASGGYDLQFQVCPTTTGRLSLRFDGQAEVAMSVLDRTGRAVWTWRPERPFTDDPHVLVSEVGACWVWETAWRQVDDDGRAVRDGRYFLEVDFLEVDDAQRYLRRFEARGGQRLPGPSGSPV